MKDNRSQPATRSERDLEVRAAVDVMFEALSHIQASLQDTSAEEHRQAYRTFKEALYDRFEHLIEKRQEERRGQYAEPTISNEAANGSTDPDASDEEDGPSKTLWPTIDHVEG